MASPVSSWLVTAPTASEVFSPRVLLFLLIFSGGFVLCAYVSGPAKNRIAGDPLAASLLARRATIGLAIFGAGLFFLGMRLLQLDTQPFAWPIWLVASTIAAAIYLVQCIRWWKSDRAARPE